MNFCTKCGNALSENANFCTVCGNTVHTTPAAPVAPAPAEPVYAYQPVVETRKEPEKAMNIAALIIVLASALLWLFAPLLAGTGASARYVFSSMFTGNGYFIRIIENNPLAVAPVFTAFFWIFCFAFTLGKKMPAVRVFAAISTGVSSLLLFLQIVISRYGLASVGFGFWAFYLGTIVLICLAGTRYKEN